MPSTKCFAQVRGSVIRVTAVDACGVPNPGATAVAVSKRISSVSFNEVSEEGTNIRERNFADELCIVDDATADLIGYGVEVMLCGVDPDLISLFTGVPVVKNAAGDTVGFDTDTSIDLDSFGFAIEVWSKIAGVACNEAGARPWGYTVAPFVKGGRLGDFSFENGAVQFSITGAQTRDGNAWGVGPFDVDLGVGPGFAESPLFTPLKTTTPFRNQMVYMDPPAATCGAVPLVAA